MITRLTLYDFQTHRKFRLDPDPRLTTLVGRSDVGKSAVLRALRWLCLNVPQGTAMIRHGAGRVKVVAAVDGHTVVRGRNGGNWYKLDGKTYRAFGAGVPDPVADLLNVGAVNFQGQHDSPYWLSLSPAEASRQLNQIINLGLIDRTLAAAHRDARRTKMEMGVCKNRLLDARERSKSLRWALQFDTDLRQVERLGELRAETAARASGIAQAASECRRATRTHRRLSDAVDDVLGVVRVGHEIRTLIARIGNLGNLIRQLKDADAALSQVPSAAEVQAFREVGQECRQQRDRVRGLAALWNGIGNLDYEVGQCDRRIKELEKKIRAAACPACGRPYSSPARTSTHPTGCRPQERRRKPNGMKLRNGTGDRSMTLQEAMTSQSS